MSKTNPNYELRAHLITQLMLSFDGPDYSVVGDMRRNGIDYRLLESLGILAAEIIKVAKQ